MPVVRLLLLFVVMSAAATNACGDGGQKELDFVTLYYDATASQPENAWVALVRGDRADAANVIGSRVPGQDYPQNIRFVPREAPDALVILHGHPGSGAGSQRAPAETAVVNITRLAVDGDTLVVSAGFPSFANNDDDVTWPLHVVSIPLRSVIDVSRLRVVDQGGAALEYELLLDD